ncbi:MAG: alpha/beta fold hydrolase [Corynebacterium sp.]|uniref:esterase/lipase family protein n=1 Tax=Corynebacterium sp. TaxID=1720 RepID=UPI0026DFBAB2|nr:alpha/beta fold hydrolase [Corynebacterium sp.]MDO5669739.1 alpha/beta fold hydrolase [Corynebacterium sp.]
MRKALVALVTSICVATPVAGASSIPRIPVLSSGHDVSSRSFGSEIGLSSGAALELSSGPVVEVSSESRLAQELGSTMSLSSDYPLGAPFNDLNCIPTPTYPSPVILIHGTAGGAHHLGALATRLAEEGACIWGLNYGANQVSALSASAGRYGYADPYASLDEVAEFIDRVKARTGSAEVDLVGHSQGGTLVKGYISGRGVADNVRRAVTLGATFRGTDVNGLGSVGTALPSSTSFWAGEAAAQQLTDSDFVSWLNTLPDAAPNVIYTALYTAGDTIATPNDTSMILTPGADAANIEVEAACERPIHHSDLPVDHGVMDLILWGLTRAPGDHSPAPGTCGPLH